MKKYKKRRDNSDGMTRDEFFDSLKVALKGLPADERGSALSYYEELLFDKLEAGLSEHEAITSMGDPYALSTFITAGSVEKRMKQKRPKRPLKSFFTLLALCTSPVLAIVGAVLFFTLLILVVTFAATGVGLFAGALYALMLSVTNTYFVATNSGAAGAAMSFFALIFAAALLVVLAIIFLKTAKQIIKIFVRILARLVKKNSKSKLEGRQVYAAEAKVVE